jgi:protein-tyrosine phosphatase
MSGAEGKEKDQFSCEADAILDNLYLGSQEAGAAPLDQLKARNITHVLIPARLNDFTYEQHGSQLVYKHLYVEDNPRYPIVPLLPEAVAFIDEARKAGGSVLVHCQFGISRSASFVIAYLMALHEGAWDFEQAWRFVGRKRPAVASNLMMFKDQLKLWHRLQYRLPPSLSSADAAQDLNPPLTAQEKKLLVRHPKNS